MTQYLVAIHHPDDYDPSVEDEAMSRDIDALNDEMVAAGVRIFVGRLVPASSARSLRAQPNGKVLITDGPYLETNEAPSSPLADSLNAATKYVATHRPDSLAWGPFEGLGPDIVEGIRRIKAMDGPGLILWGSSTLTSMLLEQGLADEILLFVYPILLGKGKRFFSDGTPASGLALTSTNAVSSGVLISTYTPAGPLRTGSLDDAAA
jgi:dihydrofolate reductase